MKNKLFLLMGAAMLMLSMSSAIAYISGQQPAVQDAANQLIQEENAQVVASSQDGKVVIKKDDAGLFVDVPFEHNMPNNKLSQKFTQLEAVSRCVVSERSMRIYFEETETQASIFKFINHYFNL